MYRVMLRPTFPRGFSGYPQMFHELPYNAIFDFRKMRAPIRYACGN